MAEILWELGPAEKRRTRLAAFIDAQRAQGESALAAPDAPDAFASLHRWSVRYPDRFWAALWRYCGVIADDRDGAGPWDDVLVGGDRMAPPDATLGPTWFTGARLNFAENLLAGESASLALVAWDERGPAGRLTFGELRQSVASCASALRAMGLLPGDRVAGFLPNIPETVIAMLAATSIGAVWSSCSPDFGAAAVIDRFGQIAPRVLICADGYQYAGKRIELSDRIAEIAAALPSAERCVIVPHLGRSEGPGRAGHLPNTVTWRDLLAGHERAAPAYERLPFGQPAFILYSSGTTGVPKCIVHSAGGTVLQLLKEHVLHVDIRRDDRVFYYTTCGWMMWNWLVNALATGAAAVLYDGAAFPPARPDILWDMAADEGVTVFGTSAKYLALAEKQGLRPGATHDVRGVRTILSTGSPLAAHSFDYVRRDVGRHVQLSSISGGTDIVSCFVLGNPLTPVRRGEIQGRGLGMAVEVFDGEGQAITGVAGELVCTQPFPSMPLEFWNDPDGEKYRAAYFARYPNTWRHGDWALITDEGGVVIYGRSDTTLNPGGVRIGTAEIYRQVEQLPEVVESVAVGAEVRGADGGHDTEVVLFVRLAPGVELDDALCGRLREAIRRNTSPHHVPRRIHAVADIPRTISGKIAELAVREAIHGRPADNAGALANPGALAEYQQFGKSLDS
jgi:acetoacetyl-CoA synthetase